MIAAYGRPAAKSSLEATKFAIQWPNSYPQEDSAYLGLTILNQKTNPVKATHLLPMVAAVLVSSLAAAQTYYRINNNLSGTNIFSSFQDAFNQAQAAYLGDPTQEAIFIVEGSNTLYDPATSFVFDFPVIIYGTGYYLDENPQTQADTRDSEITSLTFGPGSENSEVYGVKISTLSVETNNITVSKNKILLELNIEGNNCTASKNFIEGASSTALVTVTGATGLVFINNLVFNTEAAGAGNMVMDNTSSGILLYNSFWGDPDNVFHNLTVQGNYFNSSEFDLTTTSSNLTVSDNAGVLPVNFLFTSAGGDSAPLAIPDSVFCFSSAIPGTLSSDGRYQTNTGGYMPASGNPIFNGIITTHGMYGGNDPYLLSGMPRIPSVYEYTGNASGTSGSGTSSETKSRTHK